MAVTIFVICYLWVRLAELVIREPPLWLVKVVSYAVALALVIAVVLGLIRIG